MPVPNKRSASADLASSADVFKTQDSFLRALSSQCRLFEERISAEYRHVLMSSQALRIENQRLTGLLGDTSLPGTSNGAIGSTSVAARPAPLQPAVHSVSSMAMSSPAASIAAVGPGPIPTQLGAGQMPKARLSWKPSTSCSTDSMCQSSQIPSQMLYTPQSARTSTRTRSAHASVRRESTTTTSLANTKTITGSTEQVSELLALDVNGDGILDREELGGPPSKELRNALLDLAVGSKAFEERVRVNTDMERRLPILLTIIFLLISFLAMALHLEHPEQHYHVHHGIKESLGVVSDPEVPHINDIYGFLSKYEDGWRKLLPSSHTYFPDRRQLLLLQERTVMTGENFVVLQGERVPKLAREWTIACWIKTTATTGTILRKEAITGLRARLGEQSRATVGFPSTCWGLGTDSTLYFGDRFAVDVLDGSPAVVNLLTDGSWHHFGFSLNGTYARWYVDGQEKHHATLAGTFLDCDGELQLGAGMIGELADLRFYPRVLEATALNEIISLGVDVASIARGDYLTEHGTTDLTSRRRRDPEIQDSRSNQIVNEVDAEIDMAFDDFQKAPLWSKLWGSTNSATKANLYSSCEDSSTYSDAWDHKCAWYGVRPDRCNSSGNLDTKQHCPLACRECSVDASAVLEFDFNLACRSPYSCGTQPSLIHQSWFYVSGPHSNHNAPWRWREVRLDQSSTGVLATTNWTSRDAQHLRLEMRSPPFTWPVNAHFEAYFGPGGSGRHASPSQHGFLGISIRCDGIYVASLRKPTQGYSWDEAVLSKSQMHQFTGQTCQICVIDDAGGHVWSWLEYRRFRIVVGPVDPFLVKMLFFPHAVTAGTPIYVPKMNSSFGLFAWLNLSSEVARNYPNYILTKTCNGSVAWDIQLHSSRLGNASLDCADCAGAFGEFDTRTPHHFAFLLDLPALQVIVLINGRVLLNSSLPSDFQFLDCWQDAIAADGLQGALYDLRLIVGDISVGRAQKLFYESVQQGWDLKIAPMTTAPVDQVSISRFQSDIVAAGPSLILQTRNHYSGSTDMFRTLSLRSESLLATACNSLYYLCEFADGYSVGNLRWVDRESELSTRYFGLERTSFQGLKAYTEFLSTMQAGYVWRDGVLKPTDEFIDLGTSSVSIISVFVTASVDMLTLVKVDLLVDMGVVSSKVELKSIQPPAKSFLLWALLFLALLILLMAATFRDIYRRCNLGEHSQLARIEIKKYNLRPPLADTLWHVLLVIFGMVMLALITTYWGQVATAEKLIKDITMINWHAPQQPFRSLQDEYNKAVDDLMYVFRRRNQVQVVIAVYVGLLMVAFINALDCHVRLGVLRSLLSRARSEICDFVVVLFIILMIFTVVGYLHFGSEEKEFSTLPKAALQVWNSLFALQISQAMLESADLIHVLFWCLYKCINYFVVINYFLAVVVDAYMVARSSANTRIGARNFFVDLAYYLQYIRLGLCYNVPSFYITAQVLHLGGVDSRVTFQSFKYSSWDVTSYDLEVVFQWYVSSILDNSYVENQVDRVADIERIDALLQHQNLGKSVKELTVAEMMILLNHARDGGFDLDKDQGLSLLSRRASVRHRPSSADKHMMPCPSSAESLAVADKA